LLVFANRIQASKATPIDPSSDDLREIFGYDKLASTVVSLRKQIIQNGAG
jgi:hypothetical protein